LIGSYQFLHALPTFTTFTLRFFLFVYVYFTARLPRTPLHHLPHRTRTCAFHLAHWRCCARCAAHCKPRSLSPHHTAPPTYAHRAGTSLSARLHHSHLPRARTFTYLRSVRAHCLYVPPHCLAKFCALTRSAPLARCIPLHASRSCVLGYLLPAASYTTLVHYARPTCTFPCCSAFCCAAHTAHCLSAYLLWLHAYAHAGFTCATAHCLHHTARYLFFCRTSCAAAHAHASHALPFHHLVPHFFSPTPACTPPWFGYRALPFTFTLPTAHLLHPIPVCVGWVCSLVPTTYHPHLLPLHTHTFTAPAHTAAHATATRFTCRFTTRAPRRARSCAALNTGTLTRTTLWTRFTHDHRATTAPLRADLRTLRRAHTITFWNGTRARSTRCAVRRSYHCPPPLCLFSSRCTSALNTRVCSNNTHTTYGLPIALLALPARTDARYHSAFLPYRAICLTPDSILPRLPYLYPLSTAHFTGLQEKAVKKKKRRKKTVAVMPVRCYIPDLDNCQQPTIVLLQQLPVMDRRKKKKTGYLRLQLFAVTYRRLPPTPAPPPRGTLCACSPHLPLCLLFRYLPLFSPHHAATTEPTTLIPTPPPPSTPLTRV